MAKWHYYNEGGEKIGPVRGRELKALAQQGTVTPETTVEDENGRIALAKNVTGLTFYEAAQSEMSSVIVPPSAEANPFSAATPAANNPFATHSPFAQQAQEAPPPPPPVDLFCTNCGNSVSEQAIACMSCGAKPGGHKKFCHQCGVGLNPEQVVCVQCGAGLASTFDGIGNTIKDFTSTLQSTEFTSSIAEKIKNPPKPVIGAGIAIFVILCLVWFFYGSANPSALVGKWKLESSERSGHHFRLSIDNGWIEDMKLFKDGTGVVEHPTAWSSRTSAITWRAENGRLYLTSAQGSVGSWDYKISRSMLTFNDDSNWVTGAGKTIGPKTAIYRRQR